MRSVAAPARHASPPLSTDWRNAGRTVSTRRSHPLSSASPPRRLPPTPGPLQRGSTSSPSCAGRTDMSAAALKTGFSDAVSASQSVFRTIMMALARPGAIRRLDVEIDAPETLDPAAAAVALALCDFESTVWLDQTLAA